MPPMLRKVPYWYSRHYDAIMMVFEEVMRSTSIASVYVLPSPPLLAFDIDCVHLTKDSGPV
jgi:hypothetical protein